MPSCAANARVHALYAGIVAVLGASACGTSPSAQSVASAGASAGGGASPAQVAPSPNDASSRAAPFDATVSRTATDAASQRAADASVHADATLSDAGAGCGGADFCDSFEQSQELDTTRFEIVSPSCSGDGQASVDASMAHGGSRSLRVQASGGYCNHVFVRPKIATLPDPLYVRVYVRLDAALGAGHVTFLAFHDQHEDKDLRFGGQSQVLIWNRESDDATLPELSPAGIALSARPSEQAWHCLELMIASKGHALRTWLDGSELPGLVADDMPTPDVDTQWLRKPDWQPALLDARLGWESYADQANSVWFDDLAIGRARIGCN